MRTSTGSLASLLTLLGVGCTTIIGLPDLPDAASSGGSGATSGATPTAGTSPDDMGDGGSIAIGGAPSGGEPSGGKSHGGGPSGGSADGGSATGGKSTGGTEQGGTAGAAQCNPQCVTGASCVASECVCPQSQTLCSDACADLTTDKDHCGNCTTKCDSACSAGRCYTKLVDQLGTTRIAVNATHVFFTQLDAGKVGRVPRAGGAVDIIAQSQERPDSITLDQNYVYWTNTGFARPTVQKLPLGAAAGSTPQEVASTSSIDLYSLAVDANYAYWSQDGLVASIVKVPLTGGGSPTTVAPAEDNARDLALDATFVYWVNMGGGDSTGTVKKVPKAGGTVTTLASGVDYPFGLTLYGGDLYFGSSTAIYKVSTSGGAVTTVNSMGRPPLAVDANGIFAAANAGKPRPILQLTLAGAAHATLAGTDPIRSIALSGTSVFWADFTGLNVMPKAP